MGTISVQYNKKPSVVDAFKMDMSLPIIDFNVEHVEDKEYAIYSACKYKDQVIAVISPSHHHSYHRQLPSSPSYSSMPPLSSELFRSIQKWLWHTVQQSYPQYLSSIRYQWYPSVTFRPYSSVTSGDSYSTWRNCFRHSAPPTR